MKASIAGISIAMLLASGLVKSAEDCYYMDADSCRAAAEANGLSVDDNRVWGFNSTTYTPGCYYYRPGHPLYDGEAYFGEGGTDEKKRSADLPFNQVRLDCNTNLTVVPVPEGCAILDAETCRKAGEALGLGSIQPSLTADFSVDDEQSGCYYYDPDVYLGTVGFLLQGTVVYGTAGTKEEKADPSTVPASGARRLNCNTVLENGNSLPPDFDFTGKGFTGEPSSSSSSAAAMAAVAPTIIGLTLSLTTVMWIPMM